MLGTLFKVLIIVLLVLGVTAGVGLVIMAGVADTHNVKPVPVPRESSLAALAEEWDYADAFRRPMEFTTYRNIEQVIDNAPVKGDGEIHRTANEVVFAGTVPGMQYQIAYVLDRDSYPYAIELVTVYRFKGATGKRLWKLYRPIHRCLAPFLLDRLGERAPS